MKEESRGEEPSPPVEKTKPTAINGAVSMFGALNLSNVKLRSSGTLGSNSKLDKEGASTSPVIEQKSPKPDFASKPKVAAFRKEEPVASIAKQEPVKQESKPIVSETKKEPEKASVASRKSAEIEPKKETEKPASKFSFGLKPHVAPAKETTLASPSASAKASSEPPLTKPATSVANVSPEEADIRKWIETTLKDSAVFQNAADFKSALKDGSVLCK